MSNSQIYLTKKNYTILDHRNFTKYSLEIPNSNFKDLKLNSGESLVVNSGIYDINLKRGLFKALHSINLAPNKVYKVEIIEKTLMMATIATVFIVIWLLLVYVSIILDLEGYFKLVFIFLITLILGSLYSYIRLQFAKIELIAIN